MALSANRNLVIENEIGSVRYNYTVLTAAKIYKHALVVITAAGKARPASNLTTTTFVGIAEAECDTGDGTVTVNVLSNIDVQLPMATAVTVGNTSFSKIYAVDDETAGLLTTLGPEIGVMNKFISANLATVRLTAALRSKSA